VTDHFRDWLFKDLVVQTEQAETGGDGRQADLCADPRCLARLDGRIMESTERVGADLAGMVLVTSDTHRHEWQCSLSWRSAKPWLGRRAEQQVQAGARRRLGKRLRWRPRPEGLGGRTSGLGPVPAPADVLPAAMPP